MKSRHIIGFFAVSLAAVAALCAFRLLARTPPTAKGEAEPFSRNTRHHRVEEASGTVNPQPQQVHGPEEKRDSLVAPPREIVYAINGLVFDRESVSPVSGAHVRVHCAEAAYYALNAEIGMHEACGEEDDDDEDLLRAQLISKLKKGRSLLREEHLNDESTMIGEWTLLERVLSTGPVLETECGLDGRFAIRLTFQRLPESGFSVHHQGQNAAKIVSEHLGALWFFASAMNAGRLLEAHAVIVPELDNPAPGAVPQEVRIDLNALKAGDSALLTGTVLDERMHPIKGADVILMSKEYSRAPDGSRIGRWELRTDGQGVFEVNGVSIKKPATLRISKEGFKTHVETIELHPGHNLKQVVLMQTATSPSVFGLVVDGGGRPVEGAKVLVESSNDGTTLRGTMQMTGKDGSFTSLGGRMERR